MPTLRPSAPFFSAVAAAMVAALLIATGCGSDTADNGDADPPATNDTSEAPGTARSATIDLELAVPAGTDLRRRTLSLEDRFVHSGFDHVAGVLAVSISDTVPVDDSPLCAIAVDPADAARFSPADELPRTIDPGEVVITEPTAERFGVEVGDTITAWAEFWTLREFIAGGALTARCDAVVSIATPLPNDAVGALLIDLDDDLTAAERAAIIADIERWSTEP